MAEYIEKQEAKEAINREWDGCNGHYGAFSIIEYTRNAIDDLPPADVRPVVRGKWIDGRNDKWVCSECQVGNHYAYSWDSITEDYTHLQDFFCPHCGADMRGGDAELLDSAPGEP